MDLCTYDLKKKKLVTAGEIKGDTFHKKVNRKKHFCWKHKGWGISLDIISELRNKKVVALIFHVGKEQFEITLADFLRYAKKDNLGHGPQYFIAEKDLDKLGGE